MARSFHNEGKHKHMTTKSQTVAADVYALLRARAPLTWIVTREETRAEMYIAEAAMAANYVPMTWDIAAGVRELGGKPVNGFSPDPVETMRAIGARAEAGTAGRGLFFLRDLPSWLEGQAGAMTLRALRNLAQQLPRPTASPQAVVVISPNGNVPPELSSLATVIEWPLPDRDEIAALLDASLEVAGDKVEACTNGTRDLAIDAAIGLTGDEAQSCFNCSLVQHKKVDAVAIAQEKKRTIASGGLLEWFDPLKGGLDAVGGLENLKSWLVGRAIAWTPGARAYGLPTPKGALLVGVPGCGKSLTAKAISTAWQVPLLRLDLNSLKGKFVGQSEGNLRKVISIINALGRCVVWLDEIEKALAGATQGAADGGVSSDALGTILSWMQERSGEAFVIATANDVSALPPELLRKGRFDEVWFVDLPTATERAGVLTAALRSHGRTADANEVAKIVPATEGFTGAEIAAIVPDALFAAFADGAREVIAADLLAAAATVVPLAKTAAEKIAALRTWAAGRARPASKPEATASKAAGLRAIDI
jgi:hypothetical protein